MSKLDDLKAREYLIEHVPWPPPKPRHRTMKELLDSHQQVYVAACGEQFSSAQLGKQHERTCPECIRERGSIYHSQEVDKVI